MADENYKISYVDLLLPAQKEFINSLLMSLMRSMQGQQFTFGMPYMGPYFSSYNPFAFVFNQVPHGSMLYNKSTGSFLPVNQVPAPPSLSKRIIKKPQANTTAFNPFAVLLGGI